MWMFTIIMCAAINAMVLSVGVTNVGYKWAISQTLALFVYDALIAIGQTIVYRVARNGLIPAKRCL